MFGFTWKIFLRVILTSDTWGLMNDLTTWWLCYCISYTEMTCARLWLDVSRMSWPLIGQLMLTCWQTLTLLAFVIVGAEIVRVGKILVTVASWWTQNNYTVWQSLIIMGWWCYLFLNTCNSCILDLQDRSHLDWGHLGHNRILGRGTCSSCIWSLLDKARRGWGSFHHSHTPPPDTGTACRSGPGGSWSPGQRRRGHTSSRGGTGADTRSPGHRGVTIIMTCHHHQPHLAHIASRAEGVRVLGQGVAVALGGETLAHHAPGEHQGNDIRPPSWLPDSPGVPGTRGHLILLVTVAAGVIHRAPGVGQVIRGVGDTHLTHETLLGDGLSGCSQTLTFHALLGLWLAHCTYLWSVIRSKCPGKYWVRLLIWRKNERHCTVWLWRWHCLCPNMGHMVDPLITREETEPHFNSCNVRVISITEMDAYEAERNIVLKCLDNYKWCSNKIYR